MTGVLLLASSRMDSALPLDENELFTVMTALWNFKLVPEHNEDYGISSKDAEQYEQLRATTCRAFGVDPAVPIAPAERPRPLSPDDLTPGQRGLLR